MDPDNGVAGKRWRGVHVCPDSLRATWGALHAGDELVVYQHQFRDKEWRRKTLEVLSESIGVPVNDVRVECGREGPICFYCVQK